MKTLPVHAKNKQKENGGSGPRLHIIKPGCNIAAVPTQGIHFQEGAKVECMLIIIQGAVYNYVTLCSENFAAKVACSLR